MMDKTGHALYSIFFSALILINPVAHITPVEIPGT
jgi:hypothetical protein